MKTMKLKRAMLMLTLLVMTLSAVTGGTIAWFTDSVESNVNTISAGNLDVELYYQVEGQSGWTKVDENTNIFKTNVLWEPGHTEVVKLKVANEGNLAVKYQLSTNVVTETPSTNVAGVEFKLSDHIKSGVVEGDQTYTREQAVAAVDATATALSSAYKSAVTSLLADEEKVVTMVVYMPTSVGNEANHAKGAATPTIHLGVNLQATQLTHESDSFDNQYDASAPASLWNGNVPSEMPASLVVDGDTQTVHVKDAAAFAYLSTLSAKWAELYTDGNGRTYTNYTNGAGAKYYYSGQWTVSLEDDIDLANHPIAPVNIVFGESTGATVFDGNGHAIRNVNTTTGLFATRTRASYENIVLENVKATNGALTDFSDAPVKNVTVKNAVISGVDYVGGLIGKTYSSVTGCEVIDSFVLATGKEAGGLIGYAEANSKGFDIANNVVRNTSVYAGNRAAGLVAQPNVNIKVYNNTVDTVTVGAEDRSQYKPGAIVSNNLASVKDNENTVKNVVVLDEDVTIATDNTELQAAINGGKSVIVLGAGEFTADLYVVPANRKLTITGQGAATKLNFKNGQVRLELFDELTISNCTMGRMVNKSWGQLVFGSSTVAGGVYTISNCIFNGESTQGIYINQNVAATFNIENCTFNGDFGGEGAITIQNNDGVNITVNVTDCSFNNIPATSHEIYMLYAYNGFTLNAPGVDAFWKVKQ